MCDNIISNDSEELNPKGKISILSKHFGEWGSSEVMNDSLDQYDYHKCKVHPITCTCKGCAFFFEARVVKLDKDIKDYRDDKLSNVKTDKEEFSLTQIPVSSLLRLGAIFKEGEVKYGKDNWKKGVNDKEYQLERLNHALKHLLLYSHYLETGEYLDEVIDDKGRREDDLAKVMWFCATQIEIERLEPLHVELV